MNDFFGIPMNGILVVLLILLAVSLSTVAYVLFRNRVMFMVGVRNIPRRRAQTVLIIVGLMLSTLIISAALSIGDTVNYSITGQAYDRLHSVDQVVQAQSGENDNPWQAASDVTSPAPIPQGQADQFVRSFLDIPGVDGAVTVMRGAFAAEHRAAQQTAPNATIVGVNPEQMAGFDDVQALGGELLSVADLAPDEIYVNQSLAEDILLEVGDTVTIWVRNQPFDFTVMAIVHDRLLTGAAFGDTLGAVHNLRRIQELYDRPGVVDLVAVSNDGGPREGVQLSEPVTAEINSILNGTIWRASTVKADLVDAASEQSAIFSSFFMLLGGFSIAAGMLLIFLIFVMLAAERKTEMGMIRAVGIKRSHLVQVFLSEGMVYNVAAAAVGAGLGVIASLIMVRIMARLFAEFDLGIQYNVEPRSLVIAYCLGVVLTFITVTISSWRVSNLNIVSAIRDVPEGQTKRAGRWAAAIGLGAVVFGMFFTWLGYDVGQAFPFMMGTTMIVLGLAFVARFLAAPERPVFTIAGAFLLVWWLLGAGDAIPYTDHMDGDIEMFFLSGIAMVTAATLVIVFNADALLAVLARGGGLFSSLLPSVRTAIAYPMANRFRTGMTIAMISLVIFALVMMSSLNANFDRIFTSEEALGGYQVSAEENFGNPIADLQAELEAHDVDTGDIVRVDRVGIAHPRASQGRVAPDQPPGGTRDFVETIITRMSPGFIENNDFTFVARAEGLETDADVWRAVAEDPNKAVIDFWAALEGGGFGFRPVGLRVNQIDIGEGTFEPLTVEVRNGATGATQPVEIVGVFTASVSGLYWGLFLNEEPFDAVFGDPIVSRHLVQVADGADASAIAQEIESTLLYQGVQAESLRQIIDDQQALSRGFNYVLQGFMGLGLLVGIAAVGVIAFRTVVERRQQIGMLRAIGYTRAQIALSFVMESSFITLMGVLSGIALALLLARQLLGSEGFQEFGITGYYIPWVEVIAIGLFAFLASLIMTIIPSRQASSVPIADALRYE
jgi:putative ABC transport system permease protein